MYTTIYIYVSGKTENISATFGSKVGEYVEDELDPALPSNSSAPCRSLFAGSLFTQNDLLIPNWKILFLLV